MSDVAQPYPVTRGGNLPTKFQGWCQSQPVIGKKCTKCLLCWVYCPDGALRQEGKRVAVDYDYCKGCGICARECPVAAITMVPIDREDGDG